MSKPACVSSHNLRSQMFCCTASYRREAVCAQLLRVPGDQPPSSQVLKDAFCFPAWGEPPGGPGYRANAGPLTGIERKCQEVGGPPLSTGKRQMREGHPAWGSMTVQQRAKGQMPNAGHMILSIGTDGETFSHESKACYHQSMTNWDTVDWLSVWEM